MAKRRKNEEAAIEETIVEAVEEIVETNESADTSEVDFEEVTEVCETITEDEPTEDDFKSEDIETPEAEEETEEEQDPRNQADDEFMESITEQKLSPAQAKAKIKHWEESIQKAQERVDELEPIHQVYQHNGLDPVMEEVKKSLLQNVEDEKVKDIKDSAKIIEAIHIVGSIIATLNSDYTQNKRDIDRYQGEIEKLGVVQLDIFEAEQEAIEQNETDNENTTPIGPETELPANSDESELAESDGALPHAQADVTPPKRQYSKTAEEAA